MIEQALFQLVILLIIALGAMTIITVALIITLVVIMCKQ